MKILIDIGHPAHVHYFKNTANELINNGHQVIWSTKDIQSVKDLLDVYGYNYYTFPKKPDGLIQKIIKQIGYNYKLFKICKKENIDIAIGFSVAITHMSKISSFKSILFDDDDDSIQPLVTKFVHPFADSLLSPDALIGKRKQKGSIFYPGYHELAYLHPKRFKPDINVLNEIGIKQNEPFFILRFNAFKAHHDVGEIGLSLNLKLKMIEILKPYGKIFITTERDIEPELKEFQLKIKPEKIHSLMYYSTLFMGDSQTMTSEAAVLGVPSIRCNAFAGLLATLEEEEKKYGLTFAYLPKDFDLLTHKLTELLNTPNLKEEWQKKKDKLLSDKIDVTSFWVWFIENYPSSISKIETNEVFWSKFK